MKVALNKNALKQQRDKLSLYRRYLPSLELKRQQLLAAWRTAQRELAEADAEIAALDANSEPLFSLLGGSTIPTRDLARLVRVREVSLGEENVVGVRVPTVKAVAFERVAYSTLALPFWVDAVVDHLENLARLRVRRQVAAARERALEAASRKIAQRVNLFEKVLIPTAAENIGRIRIALSDQDRAAVVRSKLAKRKRAAASPQRQNVGGERS